MVKFLGTTYRKGPGKIRCAPKDLKVNPDFPQHVPDWPVVWGQGRGASRIATGELLDAPTGRAEQREFLEELYRKVEGLKRRPFCIEDGVRLKAVEEKYNEIFGKKKTD